MSFAIRYFRAQSTDPQHDAAQLVAGDTMDVVIFFRLGTPSPAIELMPGSGRALMDVLGFAEVPRQVPT